MRTIIAGSRTCTDYNLLLAAIDALPWEPTVVLSGGARGVDRMGERWGKLQGLPVERYPADWERHGRSAGFVRNRVMALAGEGLLALWDWESPGTENMLSLAREYGLQIFVWTCMPTVHPR